MSDGKHSCMRFGRRHRKDQTLSDYAKIATTIKERRLDRQSLEPTAPAVYSPKERLDDRSELAAKLVTDAADIPRTWDADLPDSGNPEAGLIVTGAIGASLMISGAVAYAVPTLPLDRAGAVILIAGALVGIAACVIAAWKHRAEAPISAVLAFTVAGMQLLALPLAIEWVLRR